MMVLLFVIRSLMRNNYTVTSEKSGFYLPDGSVWAQAYDSVTKYTPAYEKYYEDGISIGTPSPNRSGWCFPSLFKSMMSG
jgi:hypothetical protein